MPVHHSVVTIRMSREDLKSLADEVMRHIIEIHNRFDRLLIEPIDKREHSGAQWTTTTDH